MASVISSYLPPFEGLLPKWLLLVSIISIGNSIQAYTTLTYTSRLYNPTGVDPPTTIPPPGSQVTPLSARKFGTWTFLTSIIRLYAAYNINDPIMYRLAIWTYTVAWAHFMSEWWVFKTARWGTPLAGPIFVSTGSLIWMWLQWDFYAKA